MIANFYTIPGNKSEKVTEMFLKKHFRIERYIYQNVTHSYLDTFDRRILTNRRVLEAIEDNKQVWIIWRALGADQIFSRVPVVKIPRFVWELNDTEFKRRLEKIIDVRALLPIATVHRKIIAFNIFNNRGKTILRGEIQSDQMPDRRNRRNQKNVNARTLDKRLQLFPLKGYEKQYANICETLTKQCQLVPIEVDPYITTLESLRKNKGYRHELLKVKDPNERSETVVKHIFLNLLEAMEQNENGIRRDIDSEFLHDFRVAVRRTRSLLDQLNGVFPAPRLARFRREFAWFGQLTGVPRDMDVYLLSIDEFKSRLPQKIRDDLIPLHEFLLRHKKMEYKRLIKNLSSARYQKLKQDWKKFLTAPSPKNTTLALANAPVIELASKRTWRLYRKALKQGNAIQPESPASSLHQLRKTCKKLRYMNEFFHDLFPQEKSNKLIKSLKILQDNLGEFQDLEVQQISLRKFIKEMEQETGITDESRYAINMLVDKFEKRDRLVRAEFSSRFLKFSSPSNRKLYKEMYSSGLNSRRVHG